MKKFVLLLTLLISIQVLCQAQLTNQIMRDSAVRKYHIGTYSYHEAFIGHKGYGSPQIITADGGGAAFGDGDEGCMLVKLRKDGSQQWKKILTRKGDEMESQSVVEDAKGNFYVFILVYDNTKYRGGCERVVFLNKSGTIMWDKFIGSCNLVNNPVVSYILALPDGRILMRGHMVTVKPAEGQDPVYHYWEGWLNAKGVLTQKTGAVIDWNNKEWKAKFSPEK